MSAPTPTTPGLVFRPAIPCVIGLVGGVASGKSAVAKAFAARGLCHVDADQHARDVVGRTEILAALCSAFGADILDEQGALNRAALADRIFADQTARLRLEAITHPAIRAAILTAAEEALSAGQSVLLDVPLLLEAGLISRCDVVVFVHASDAVRATRAASRGWKSGELARREAAQAPLAEKRMRAKFVIDNDGPLPLTQGHVDDLLRKLTASL